MVLSGIVDLENCGPNYEGSVNKWDEMDYGRATRTA
jgi:hypothetical protein